MLAIVLLIEVLNVFHALLIILFIYLMFLFLACIGMRIRIYFFEWIDANVIAGYVDSICFWEAIFEVCATTYVFI